VIFASVRAVLLTALGLMASLWTSFAAAGDSPFGYVYTTDTHPKGTWEIEQWVTNRSKQSRGDFDAWEYRTELEYGVTENLQGSFYLNYGQVNAFRNRPDGTTGPGAFVPDDVDPNARYSNRYLESASTEWIYRVLSPYKDGIGLALYIEPTYGPRKRELESRLIVQKNFMQDRLVWAANLIAAQEKERFHGDWEKESEFQVTTGLAYAFLPRWYGGVEYRRHTGFEGYGFSGQKRQYTANFIGPSLHYSRGQWWFTATYLTQLGNAKAYTDEAGADIIGGRMFGEHHERNELRLRVGFNF